MSRAALLLSAAAARSRGAHHLRRRSRCAYFRTFAAGSASRGSDASSSLPALALAAAAATFGVGYTSASDDDAADGEGGGGAHQNASDGTSPRKNHLAVRLPSLFLRPILETSSSTTICGCEAAATPPRTTTAPAAPLEHQLTCDLRHSSTTAYSAPSRYDIDPTPLGEGAFGTVHLATDRLTHERFALKRISKEYTDDISLRREMDALLRIRRSGGHPHICSLRENFDEGDAYVLVLDLIAGGEMFDHLIENGAYSELDASRLVREVAGALAFLHGVGIVHVDLKPENLMLSSRRASEGVVKVVDFGSAEVSVSPPTEEKAAAAEGGKAASASRAKGGSKNERCTYLGRTTSAYCPPEVIRAMRRDDAAAEVDPALDMWSLGIILYIMLAGCHPFDPKNEATDDEIEERILAHRVTDLVNADGKPEQPCLSHLSPAALDLLTKLLTEDPAARISSQEMLSHPWVLGENARSVKMREVSERLAAFKGLKSEIEKTMFERLVDWSGRAAKNGAEGGSSAEEAGPLMERAFRSFDREGKGRITVDDVAGGSGAAVAVNCSSNPLDSDWEEEPAALTLSDFSELVNESMKSRFFPAGQVVYEEGDRGDHLYFIDSGTVAVSTRDGFRTTLGHGSTFGEGAMFDPESKRSATIRCTTPVHAIEVNRECFARYLGDKDERSQGMHLNLRERTKMRKFGRAEALLSQRKDLREIVLQHEDKVFESGDGADSVFVVDRGSIITRATNGGNVVFTAGPGDLFGLSSIYMHRIHNEEAVCADPAGCAIRAISAEGFQKMIREAPAMQEALQELFLRREIRRAVVTKLNKSFPSAASLREAFDAIDTDSSGELDRDELRELLLLLDESMSDENIEGAIKSLDLDDSGLIGFEEFKRIFATNEDQ